MNSLKNPETGWVLPSHRLSIDDAEITRRLGAVNEACELLHGGLANCNVKIGKDKVLRIYQREPAAAHREAQLLSRPWSRLRVPRVLQEGPDFLLLEYVPHAPIQAGSAHGAALGAALAEIHASPCAQAGFFDQELQVTVPFPGGMLEFFTRHALELIASPALEAHAHLRGPLEHFYQRHGARLAAQASTSCLLHGDFKASNLHWTESGLPLVLDWEFAYAGSPWMDLGQMARFGLKADFADAFALAYGERLGRLPKSWLKIATGFDLFNLVELLSLTPDPLSQRAQDLAEWIRRVLTHFE